MEIRYKIQMAMDRVLPVSEQVDREFGAAFGRSYGVFEVVNCDDAETVLVTTCTTSSPARVVIKQMREAGHKVGLLKIRYFRPFPVEAVRAVLRGKKKAVVIDRNISFGKGGIWADEIRGACAGEADMPQVFGFIMGLGGRDITPELLRETVEDVRAKDKPESLMYWKGLKL